MKKALLLLLFPLCLFGQSTAKIDSLQKIVSSDVKIGKKKDAYFKLLDYYQDRNLQKVEALNKELEAFTVEQCVECKVVSLYHRGFLHYRANRLNEAVIEYNASAELADKYNDLGRYDLAKMAAAQALIYANRTDEAQREIDAYLANPRYTTDNPDLYRPYFLLGIMNYNKGYLKTAIENYIKAEEMLEGQPGRHVHHVGNLNNIAQAYRQLKDYEKTRHYVTQAFDHAIKSRDSVKIMNIRLHQGIIESEAGNPRGAIPYLKQSLAFFDGIYPHYTGSSLLYLGIVYHNLKEYETSQKYLKRGEQNYIAMNDKFSLSEVYGYMARNLVALKKLEEAKVLIDKIKEMLSGYESAPQYIEIMTAEVQYYEAMGDHKKAMETFKKQVSLNRDLEKKMSKTEAMELEAKYETKQQQEQIKTLSLENQVVDAQKKTQSYVYLGVVGLLLLLGASAFFIYRNKIRTANRLQEVNDMKSRFFANISHEFRTPLTLIKSPVQNLKDSGIDSEQRQQAELIDRNADRMLDLVNQLIELSKLDGGHLKLILKKGSPTEFLSNLTEPFEFEAKNKGIVFEHHIHKAKSTHEFDRDVLEKITSNLLSNAFKYHTGKGSIAMVAMVADENLKLEVSNTTDNLKHDDLGKIFERFYQKKENQNSSGIGLALVKELVELYKGSVQSRLNGDRLTFSVSLPMPKVDADAEIVQESLHYEIPEGKPLLLIVDDNSEIRSVVKNVFSQHYTVIEAVDGMDALEIARREIPDAIVSDVMMPKMDGFEFASKIKSDELTSFIPVVMLTAKTSDDAHLEALKHSADAFLTKPFNHEILRSTVANLLSDRKKLQERYSQELILRPVDIAVTSADEKFVMKLQTVLDLHMTNPNFSAEDFADAVGMSRMQLHRKLKSLLGVTTTEFLRNERLNAAAVLLEKGNLQVSDAAYSVGFNDLSYFSKCFKERFNCTPTEFMTKP